MEQTFSSEIVRVGVSASLELKSGKWSVVWVRVVVWTVSTESQMLEICQGCGLTNQEALCCGLTLRKTLQTNKQGWLQSTTKKQTRLLSVSLLWHKRHTATHTCILGGDTGHTHTHTRRPRSQWIFPLHFSHPGLSFLQDPRSSGQRLGARGPSQVNYPSWSGTERINIIHYYTHNVLFDCLYMGLFIC